MRSEWVGEASMGGVTGHNIESNGNVGDHVNVMGSPILDCLGNVSTCGNLANSPGLRPSLPLAVEHVGVAIGVWNRAVESESRKKSKSRKKPDKVGKVGFDFLSDFWQKSTSLMEMS